MKQERKKLFILSRNFLSGSRPVTVIDYNEPESIRIGRNFADYGQQLLDIIDLPVPFVGSGLRLIYKYLVDRPIEKAKKYEARLTSHLLQRISRGELKWENELRILYGQRLNPFMLSRSEEIELIEHRKEHLGLSTRSFEKIGAGVQFH